MSHTYTDVLLHIVFSTKERRRFSSDKMERLRAYLGGIAKKNRAELMAVGGTEDHAHMLIAVPTTMTIAKFVQLSKGGASKWFNDTFSDERFAWQEGFAVFSVSRSHADSVVDYIRSQSEHHARRDFASEYQALLRKHAIAFDPKYVLG